MHPVIAALGALDPARRARVVRSLAAPEDIAGSFDYFAHGGQSPPPGDWRTWVLMAGRGYGKTRAGAEWVLGVVRGSGVAPAQAGACVTPWHPTLAEAPACAGVTDSVRIALIAASIDEARAVMVEGPSGLLACARDGEIADWSPSNKLLRFSSGAEARLYSGAHAEGLRGADLDLAWCDELAKWPQGKQAWANLQLALRRPSTGSGLPRCLITTTPRGKTVLGAILARPDTVRTGGATRDNPFNAPGFAAALEAEHGGTRWGAQELEGKLLEDVEGSLWPADLIERSRYRAAPAPFSRVVIGVDPPASVNGTCGIVVCGRAADGFGYVLADRSVSGASPEGWARAVVAAAAHYGADRVIAEVNQGGDMVKSTLAACSAALPVRMVRATRGKVARAEPVAALFENGRAWLSGRFPELEAELTGLTIGGGYEPGSWSGPGGPNASPDRADAMVWALWALLLEPQRAEPRVRRF